MFAKLSIIAAATMAIFVAAVPTTTPAGGINNSCNTQDVHCCNSLTSYEHASVDIIHQLLSANVGAITGQLGLDCSPIGVLAIAGGNSCSAQPACCTGNKFNGITVGCTPIDVL